MMKTCLIVDDSRVIRSVARRIVTDLGFAVREAENGLAALDVCETDLPDVILLDWNMPKMGGLEFLRALRQLPDGHLPKVVFCTTENGITEMQEAMTAGADEFIMKPFDADIVEERFAMVGLI